MKVTLANGNVLEGTSKEILSILNQLKEVKFRDNEWYYSRTKNELVLVEDMATRHLRNAIITRTMEHLEQAKSIKNNKEFVDWVCNIPEETEALLDELEDRKD